MPGRAHRTQVVKAPAYAITSVDHALRTLLLLRERDGVGVREVAERIGTAPSTAHRVLSTLKYRGFASQDDSRLYHLGPAMEGVSRGASDLDLALRPTVTALRDRTGETVHAMVLDGRYVRPVFSVESTNPVRVTERTGSMLPAATTSVGKALLAQLPRPEVQRRFVGRTARLEGFDLAPGDLTALMEELDEVLATGLAFNLGTTEGTVAAVGSAVPARTGPAWIGLALSIPMARKDRVHEPELHVALREAVHAVAIELDARGVTGA